MDIGGWELILLVLALLFFGSVGYAFVWTVRRVTQRGADTSRPVREELDALRARVEEIERRSDGSPGRNG